MEGELSRPFQIPKVINSSIPDSISKSAFHEEKLSYTYIPFVGKFKIQDEIDINENTWYSQVLDDLKVEDYSWMENPLKLTPDFRSKLTPWFPHQIDPRFPL
jgi:hypothetical protein